MSARGTKSSGGAKRAHSFFVYGSSETAYTSTTPTRLLRWRPRKYGHPWGALRSTARRRKYQNTSRAAEKNRTESRRRRERVSGMSSSISRRRAVPDVRCNPPIRRPGRAGGSLPSKRFVTPTGVSTDTFRRGGFPLPRAEIRDQARKDSWGGRRCCRSRAGRIGHAAPTTSEIRD